MLSNPGALVALEPSVTPVLPSTARTRSGVEFDPRAHHWSYRDETITVSLNFAALPATATLIASAKLVLLWYAEQKSPSHLVNMFARLLHCLTCVSASQGRAVEEINGRSLISYRATLNNKSQWYLGSLAGLLKKWIRLGYAGVTPDAVTLLSQLRIPGNTKGEAVLTHDPLYGPFTDIELSSLHAALDRAFARGEVDREGYLLAYLFMLLGQRSVQYAALKVSDVSITRTRDGRRVYVLRVPRAKQRNQLARTQFKSRVLTPKIGELLIKHAGEIRAKFRGRLQDPSEAPLFPARKIDSEEPPGFECHRTRMSVALFLRGTLERLNVISERTGQPLNVSCARFRRTLASRAAVEGHGELIIAELLDHTDTQNVGVYIEALPEIVERIDRAVAMRLAPIAQAFAGTLIRNESEATRGGDPTSRVCDPRFAPSMEPMGNCGKYGFCGLMAPLACYTCVNFQPWLDGPHEAVLQRLIGERDRLAGRGDMRIASLNDRTILAVAEVVRLCEQQGVRGGAAAVPFSPMDERNSSATPTEFIP